MAAVPPVTIAISVALSSRFFNNSPAYGVCRALAQSMKQTPETASRSGIMSLIGAMAQCAVSASACVST